jgi:hypothetical protein
VNAAPDEKRCTDVGEIMERFAIFRESKIPKDFILEMLEKSPPRDENRKRLILDILNFVYATQVNSQSGREIGFNKCMEGFFEK